MRHPGVPQKRKMGPREMNSKMVVVVVGASPIVVQENGVAILTAIRTNLVGFFTVSPQGGDNFTSLLASAPDPLFKASEAPFLTLRVATL